MLPWRHVQHLRHQTPEVISELGDCIRASSHAQDVSRRRRSPIFDNLSKQLNAVFAVWLTTSTNGQKHINQKHVDGNLLKQHPGARSVLGAQDIRSVNTLPNQKFPYKSNLIRIIVNNKKSHYGTSN
ncbi:hypothetical protein [Rubrivivax benzoatilyticus]|uniref:hypothetical protein n=1 Tax=Rubrivivax benzoatilyticus TaxID=316997 RepID=UPI0019802F7E|nr:hypothetical protein [Rubrivivax benzoatilyticus]